MPKSCKSILDRMVYKGAMTEAERDKILRNIKLDWIPVTERLPDREAEYLVTKEHLGTKEKRVTTEWWIPKSNNWSCFKFGWEITAWAETPPSYERSEEDADGKEETDAG